MDLSRLLYRDQEERERLLDMGGRLAGAQLLAMSTLLVPVALALPVYGLQAVLPIIAAGLVFAGTRLPAIHDRCGDWASFGSFVFAQAMVLLTVAVAEGPVIYLMCAPIFPVLLAAIGFRRATVAVASVLSIVGLVAVTLTTAPDQIEAMPPALWVPVLLLVVIVFAAMAVRDADMVTRDDAVVDELTGLFNRTALMARVAELTHQVRDSHERVAVLVADLDHFKHINDTHGHAAGDRVLAEVAQRLVDAADGTQVYRFGGEEFVVLLAGANEKSARALADRMRIAVAASPIDGRRVTTSVGVAVTAPDDGFDYRAVFRQADAAMYAAKAFGRDQVRVAGDVELPGAAEAEPDTAPQAVAPEAPRAPEGNWLVRDAIARAHLVDIVERTRSGTKVTSSLVTLAIVSMVPWLGWQMLIPVFVSGAIVEVGVRGALRTRRPELIFLPSFILMQLGAALTVLIAGPDILFALPIFAIAMFGCGTSLPGRGAGVLVVTGSVSMAAAALAVGASEVAANPLILALPLALQAALAIVGSAMGGRVAELRVAAISDELTGALNRVALEARIAELAHLPAGRQPIAVVVADLDHFKTVNDVHGHAAGDRVLAEIGVRIRGELRAFDAVYRIGGEEFVILLPGASTATAAQIAQRIRERVARTPAAGLPMTISLGVASSPAGVALDYDATFAMADAALLAAKREGRNRVVLAGTTSVAPEPGGMRTAPSRIPPEPPRTAAPGGHDEAR